MSEHLSMQRIALLLRNELVESWRAWLTASAVVAGVILFTRILAEGPGQRETYFGWFAGTLFVWGTIMTSMSLGDLHDKSKNVAFLTLPASSLEKTLVPLLLATAGLFVYLLVFMTVVSFAMEGIFALSAGYGDSLEPFAPFDSRVWSLLPHYLVVQSLFFAGAAWFRRARYLMTGLALLGLSTVLWLVAVVALWITGAAQLDGVSLNVRADVGYWFSQSSGALASLAEGAFHVGYFVILPIFCWFLAWLRVTETEVSHGV